MEDNILDKTYVKISNDGMEAYLYLAVQEGKQYTIEDLHTILQSNRVIFGIIEPVLEEVIEKGIYHREVMAAKGQKPVDGIEGRYEYHFDSTSSGKPKIRPDGTVDYLSAFAVQMVAEGETIATYHPSLPGTPGKTVTGKVIEAKKGKDLLPLKGKGFGRSEDGRSYIASTTGKIVVQNDRIIISNLLEIREDLDYNNGKIEFRGDIIIHGNVESAGYIRAGGSVTIDGSVEDTTIIAGKDVILKKGMQGANKAVIQSGGNIIAKFIEGCKVEAKGDVQADVLMNCSILSGGEVKAVGSKATILGGIVQSASRIEAAVAGNAAEAQTKLMVGMDDKMKERVSNIKVALKVIDEKLEGFGKELVKLENRVKELPAYAKEKGKERITELLRSKIKYTSDKAEFKNELAELEERSQKSQGAIIVIQKYIYPGVTVQANTAFLMIKEKQYAMKYRYEGGEVVMYDFHQQEAQPEAN